MKILKNYTYSWWQIGLLKLSLLSFGIVIGAYWSETFLPCLAAILGLGIITAIYMIAVSLKQ